MSSLYEAINKLSINKIPKEDIDVVLDKLIKIEYSKNFKKEQTIRSRNILSENLSLVYDSFNDKIINMKDDFDKKYYTMNELKNILNCSLSTIKSWKKTGVLKCEQDEYRCSVVINRNAIEECLSVLKNKSYLKIWENYKI